MRPHRTQTARWFCRVAATPARAGEVISLWGTASGPSNPSRRSGIVINAASLANPVTVRIGGAPAPVSSAGLVAPGLCQFNVTVPSGMSGDQTVTIAIGGQTSPPKIVLPLMP